MTEEEIIRLITEAYIEGYKSAGSVILKTADSLNDIVKEYANEKLRTN